MIPFTQSTHGSSSGAGFGRFEATFRSPAAARSVLDQAHTIWRKRITVLRNDVYAHLSDIDFGAKFSEADISPDEIERLIKLSKDLLNKLCYARDRSAPGASSFAFNLDRLVKTEG